MTILETTRQGHRWLGMLFTLAVAANFIAMALVGTPPTWLTYLPLAPLTIMLPTGIYLFFRSSRQSDSQD